MAIHGLLMQSGNLWFILTKFTYLWFSSLRSVLIIKSHDMLDRTHLSFMSDSFLVWVALAFNWFSTCLFVYKKNNWYRYRFFFWPLKWHQKGFESLKKCLFNSINSYFEFRSKKFPSKIDKHDLNPYTSMQPKNTYFCVMSILVMKLFAGTLSTVCFTVSFNSIWGWL